MKHHNELRKRLAIFIRKQRGSQKTRAFAKKMGISQRTMIRIENEEQNVTIDTIDTLCKAFKCDIEELFPKLPTGKGKSSDKS